MTLSKRRVGSRVALGLLAAGLIAAPVAALHAQTASPAPMTVAPRGGAAFGHLSRFHDLLGITPAQQPLWDALVAVVRQDAQQQRAARVAVEQKHPDALARLEALHDQVLPARAEHLAHFIAAFRPLYESFSPEQKRQADALSALLFRRT